MFNFTFVVGVFGIIGGICGVWSLIYVRRQTKLLVEDISDRKKRNKEDDSWSQRFENLQRKLLRINPRLQVQEPGNTKTTWIYTTMYPDRNLRLNIENFIIEVNAPGNLFLPRKPQPHEFRSISMRETIERAEAEMEKFVHDHPFCEQHLTG